MDVGKITPSAPRYTDFFPDFFSVIEDTFATILRNTYPKDKPPTPAKEAPKKTEKSDK